MICVRSERFFLFMLYYSILGIIGQPNLPLFFCNKSWNFQVFFRYFRNFFMSPYRANIVASLLPYKTKVGVLYICRKYGQVSFLFSSNNSAGPGKTCLVFPLTGSGNSNDQDSISNSLMIRTPSGLNLNPESGRKSCHHDRMADSSVMSWSSGNSFSSCWV